MTEPKIYQAMVNAMKDMEAIGKDSKNIQQGFNFRGIDDIYNMVHSILAKNEIFTIPTVLKDETEERQTKSGANLIYRKLLMQYRFYTVDGSYVDASALGEGMDSGDKASNKAMSVAHKYTFLQTFSIPTREQKDPDYESHDVMPHQGGQNRAVGSKNLTKPLTGSEAVERAKELINARNAPSSDTGNFTVSFGKYKDKKIKELPINDVINYVDYLLKMSATNQKPLSPAANDFIINAKAFIAAASDAEDMPPPEYPQYDDLPIPFMP